MRFLVDECCGPLLAQWLNRNGHDAFSVFENMRGSDDETILRKAYLEQRILISNDRNFESAFTDSISLIME